MSETDTGPWALEMSGVSKHFGRAPALDRLDLRVPRTGVHGFLGPNGSGKSTSIRAMLGLVRVNAGAIRIFGRPVPAALPEVINRVGAIVERPRFYPEFSGRKNLRLLALAIRVPATTVDRVLDLVGLTGSARQRFGTYSLGMKQRLAIAATLLRDPDLVILDEPTNGLDPEGIRDTREMMRGLADMGKAVLVSTHHLGAVEEILDTVSVIKDGHLVAEGRLTDILPARARVRVRIGAPSAALAALRHRGWQVTSLPDHLEVHGDRPDLINRHLTEAGLWPDEISLSRPSLEEAYVRLIETAPPAAAPLPQRIA
ncbi:ABC transporter ATP-binding protein [Granulicoccus phenolivorans]|uniref:ABC transporter ATP-binding protein n=1 Tax=Granulicoccus phenolivorans TaxID=266854 RepID=UPI000685E484|nr:ATP-binding cassette domain-containing protein [Granulicoccus phenolivorans]